VRKKCSHSILDVVVSDSTSTVAAEEDLVAECMDGLGDGKLLLSGEVSSAAAVVVRRAGKKGWSRKGTTGRRRRGSKAAGGRARMSWLKETGPRLTTHPDRAQNTSTSLGMRVTDDRGFDLPQSLELKYTTHVHLFTKIYNTWTYLPKSPP
jgi:hypothetical protein